MADYKFPRSFGRFFDDAAVFPPGLATLEVAIRDHIVRKDSVLGPAIGPLVLPLRDLPTARTILADTGYKGGPVEVSVVTPAGHLEEILRDADSVTSLMKIVAVELKTHLLQADWKQELLDARATAGECHMYVELTADQITGDALRLIKEAGARLKYRTGGIEADLFPTPEQLAFVVGAAAEYDVPFKLTAGLHRAARYTDQKTGFTHHGFLNIAVATALAREGRGSALVIKALCETQPMVLADMYAGLDAAWRRSFTSFGTCSITEPLQSLEDMEILPSGASAIAASLEKANQL
ncbi:hypothetical protein [Paenarthrobacter ureafaciens]|uniref:hypothetical protein n=1 Tax=Paenarthrobacter ureafaciens TaxID=37931 RepID=UPI002DB731FC|nr:hypothetical protein [Paenarthrobacter ureafaciens]MEC3853658.1 hypothetical protein [Paenarthrobacter ureafaciens]